MMLSEIDHGIRCEKHVGEVFPPRCRECAALALERDLATAPARFASHLDEECPEHVGYPHPESRFGCDRCLRDAVEVAR